MIAYQKTKKKKKNQYGLPDFLQIILQIQIYIPQFYTLQNSARLKESLLPPTSSKPSFLPASQPAVTYIPSSQPSAFSGKKNYISSPELGTQTSPCFTCSLWITNSQHHTSKNTFRYFICQKTSSASTCHLFALSESFTSVLKLR